MKDLGPYRVFLEVDSRRSFAGAARALRMTPASVTRIIAALEDDLGQQLFVRTTRQVSLTSAGALVAARISPIVAEFDRASTELAEAVQTDQGQLSINAPMSLGLRLMPGIVASFRLAYPRITLNVQMTDALVDIVASDCDLAIRISGPPTDKSSIWRKICEVPRVTVAAPSLFDRVTRPETPNDLNPDLCLSYSADGTAETWRFTKGTRRRSVFAGTAVTSNNGELLAKLAAAGDGIVNLPTFLVQDAIDRGEVMQILTDWQTPPLFLMLYYPPYVALPPLVATFSAFFEDWIKQTDGFDFGAKTA